MSYEITIYAGIVVDRPWSGDVHKWLIKRAILEMGAWGYDSALYTLKPQDDDPHVFFYADDGDTEISTDKYGTELRAMSIKRVVEALEADCGIDRHWSLACLREMQRMAADNWRDDIRVVLFGH